MRLVITFKEQGEPCFIRYSFFNLFFFFSFFPFTCCFLGWSGLLKGREVATVQQPLMWKWMIFDFPLLRDSLWTPRSTPCHKRLTLPTPTPTDLWPHPKAADTRPCDPQPHCTRRQASASCQHGASARPLAPRSCPHGTEEQTQTRPGFPTCSWQASFGYTFCTRSSSFLVASSPLSLQDLSPPNKAPHLAHNGSRASLKHLLAFAHLSSPPSNTTTFMKTRSNCNSCKFPLPVSWEHPANKPLNLNFVIYKTGHMIYTNYEEKIR